MRFAVLSLFPKMITDGMGHSVLKRAQDAGILQAEAVDIRDYADNKHRQADDYPYGGGCGMVMTPGPVYAAWLKALARFGEIAPKTLYMTPRGKPFNQAIARELSKEAGLIIICGHYEGVDERAIELIAPLEISLGDFVLTGGELPALAVIDAVSRLLPGVLGNAGSAEDESFSAGLLEYPQYTRPAVFMGKPVPPVLLSGHHQNVERWRRERAYDITQTRRPELLEESMEHSDKLILTLPTPEMKEAALAFLDEFIRDGGNMNGFNGLNKCGSYEEWLERLNKSSRGELEGRLASTTFFPVSAETGEIIGIIDVRHKLIDDHNHLPSYVNGHLGGSIRPSKRRRGYAAQMLALGVQKSADLGNTRVMVSCDKWNTASERVIRSCGGVFLNEVTEQDGNIILRFYIDAGV